MYFSGVPTFFSKLVSSSPTPLLLQSHSDILSPVYSISQETEQPKLTSQSISPKLRQSTAKSSGSYRCLAGQARFAGSEPLASKHDQHFNQSTTLTEMLSSPSVNFSTRLLACARVESNRRVNCHGVPDNSRIVRGSLLSVRSLTCASIRIFRQLDCGLSVYCPACYQCRLLCICRESEL